ncbi:MAG: hypothetical protein RJA47_1416 [Actinomycetota bacterium]
MSTPVSADLLEEYPRALFDAVTAVFEGWLRTRTEQLARGAGRSLSGPETAALAAAVVSAADEARDGLCALLATDVDEQRQNPLHVLRSSIRPVTRFLRTLGVPENTRDEFEMRAMPDDSYAIGPLAWIDMGEDVHEAGISWGAWKAATVLTRRRAEGMRREAEGGVG